MNELVGVARFGDVSVRSMMGKCQLQAFAAQPARIDERDDAVGIGSSQRPDVAN